MPTYDFKCENGHLEEHYIPLRGGENPPCDACGGKTERLISVHGHVPASAFPYTTTHIHPQGKPIEVKSALHLRSLEKQYGVRLRDDAAYLTQEYLGWDSRNRRQVYRESGRGMPGVWV